MLIGFRLDLTDLAPPGEGQPRARQRAPACRGKEGWQKAEKSESGFKKNGRITRWMVHGRGAMEQWRKCARYCQLACRRKKVLTAEVTQS